MYAIGIPKVLEVLIAAFELLPSVELQTQTLTMIPPSSSLSRISLVGSLLTLYGV